VDSNLVAALIIALVRALRRLLRPACSPAKLMIGAAGDLTSTRSELMAEIALLRQLKSPSAATRLRAWESALH